MQVLVTGAGGFVGKHTLSSLIAAGHETIGCSHRPFFFEGVSAIEIFDISDFEIVNSVMMRYKPNLIVHLAAQASVRHSWEDPGETYRTNFVGVGNLLHALRDRPSTRVLLVGSAQEYGNVALDRPIGELDPLLPLSPYSVTKVAQGMLGSLYFRETGLQVISVRPFNHTGPGQSTEYAVADFSHQLALIESGRAEPAMRVGRLDSIRDFLDVRDVVEAYLLLLERGIPGRFTTSARDEGSASETS